MSWPVSTTFQTKLRRSHTPTMLVELLEDGEVVASTGLLTDRQIVVIEGSVSEDRKAGVGRRTASLTLVDPTGSLVPLAVNDPTYPLRDIDVRLWRGIGDELVPVATVQLETSTVTDDEAARTWQLAGTDRSRWLANSHWRSELVIAAGTTPRAATLAILDHVDPGHTYTVVDTPTDKTLDRLTFVPGDVTHPWAAITKAWEAAALEVFPDQLGQIKSQPIPDVESAPVAWEFLDDGNSIRIAPLSVAVDRATLRNGVIVRASAPWLLYGVVGEAWDTDPASSTYFDPADPTASAVGPHPEYIDDSLVSDETEATALAEAKLPDLLGIEEQVQLAAIPNPALEAGDVVRLATDVTGTAARFIFDQLETPLTFDGGAQRGHTRRRVR